MALLMLVSNVGRPTVHRRLATAGASPEPGSCTGVVITEFTILFNVEKIFHLLPIGG